MKKYLHSTLFLLVCTMLLLCSAKPKPQLFPASLKISDPVEIPPTGNPQFLIDTVKLPKGFVGTMHIFGYILPNYRGVALTNKEINQLTSEYHLSIGLYNCNTDRPIEESKPFDCQISACNDDDVKIFSACGLTPY